MGKNWTCRNRKDQEKIKRNTRFGFKIAACFRIDKFEWFLKSKKVASWRLENDCVKEYHLAKLWNNVWTPTPRIRSRLVLKKKICFAETGLQTDSLKPLCDWPTKSQSGSESAIWLVAVWKPDSADKNTLFQNRK